MTNKSFTRLVIVLLILIGILLIVANPFKGPTRSSAEGGYLFPGLHTGEPAVITVDGSNDLSLWIKDGEWLVRGAGEPLEYPADTAGVNRALRVALAARDREKISTNPAKRSIFEVDSTGTFVRILDPDSTELAAFYIGKAGADYAMNYVRLDGEDAVYMVGERIKSQFDRPWNGLRKMTVLKVDKDEIARIDIVRESDTVTYQRQDDDSWAILAPEEGKAEQTYMTRLVNTIGYLRGDDFVSPEVDEGELGFKDPFIEISIIMKDGTEHTVVIGNEVPPEDPDERMPGRWYTKKVGSSWAYELGKYRVETLLKPVDEIIEREPEIPDSLAAEIDSIVRGE